MKVILIENVQSLGKIGDIADVKDGYARNFLLPKKLALPATEENVKRVQKKIQEMQRKIEIEKMTAEELDRKLRGLLLTIPKKCGEKDTIFGSVTVADILEALSKVGLEIEKKKIQLSEPIKKLGIYTIPIKLNPSLTSEIKIEVVKGE